MENPTRVGSTTKIARRAKTTRAAMADRAESARMPRGGEGALSVQRRARMNARLASVPATIAMAVAPERVNACAAGAVKTPIAAPRARAMKRESFTVASETPFDA